MCLLPWLEHERGKELGPPQVDSQQETKAPSPAVCKEGSTAHTTGAGSPSSPAGRSDELQPWPSLDCSCAEDPAKLGPDPRPRETASKCFKLLSMW